MGHDLIYTFDRSSIFFGEIKQSTAVAGLMFSRLIHRHSRKALCECVDKQISLPQHKADGEVLGLIL
jgi:hypothetical protein